MPYLFLHNISTISHVTTCKNALKSVDSYLKTERYCYLFTDIDCLVQPRRDLFDSLSHQWYWYYLSQNKTSNKVFPCWLDFSECVPAK